MAEATKTDEKVETQEEEVQIDEGTLKAISTKVGEDLLPTLEENLGKKIAESVKALGDQIVESTEKTIKASGLKEAKVDESAEDPIAKGLKANLFDESMVKESKEMRFFKAANALVTNDALGLQRYNALSAATREKAGYANEGTVADGGALVPDAEFDTTVYENLPKYGVAFANADVRQTDRTSVRFLSLDSGLQFYATAEAGVKTGAKLSFSKQLTDLLKYAVIVPSTDELADDAAIDFWNLVTRELSRAYAKLADEIVFTDAVSGITNTAGVITQPVSGAGTTISWDDLLAAEGKTEDDLAGNSKWYMRKETWFRLLRTKASGGTGDYLFNAFMGNPNSPSTPWGTPVVFTRVLPSSGLTQGSPGAVGSNDGFAVFGDLSNYVLYNKRGMALTVLREATIVDAASQNFNLATQDGTAMRAVVRLLGKLPKGNTSKFVVVGTGTVS